MCRKPSQTLKVMQMKQSIKNKFKIKTIKNFECDEWLLYKHYAKRMCMIKYCFGLYKNNVLSGVCTFGKPASNALCIGVCGDKYESYVYELNRLCISDGMEKNTLSFFVGSCLKLLPEMIVVSYADTSMGHHGYIYQATNWIYTGLSEKRSEWRIKNSNRHSKTITFQHSLEERKTNKDKFEVVDRPRKHRYIYFVGSKTKVKEFKKNLNYKIQTYPKGRNTRYDSSYNPTTQQVLF